MFGYWKKSFLFLRKITKKLPSGAAPQLTKAGKRTNQRKKPSQQSKKQSAAQLNRTAVHAKTSLWRRVPVRLYWMLGAAALVITCLEAYPWLSIEEGPLLEPQNVFSELFLVSNTGYWPIRDLSVNCAFSGEDKKAIAFDDNILVISKFADYLPHSGSVTLPCFRTATGYALI